MDSELISIKLIRSRFRLKSGTIFGMQLPQSSHLYNQRCTDVSDQDNEGANTYGKAVALTTNSGSRFGKLENFKNSTAANSECSLTISMLVSVSTMRKKP
ncbi:hypothetical protein Tcan_00164 [Toxocara canis]|uniref:Uncharacterized protein n=1 Tax=Toxocara canis TaxID=6265 RepID=A0A0B2V065_TOXCA|nr:hypothetical protein Tcan_00164 [Toxocara canis]